MNAKWIRPLEGDRLLRVSGTGGIQCFDASLRGSQLLWEYYPNSLGPAARWTFGAELVSDAEATEFQQLFDACTGFPTQGFGVSRKQAEFLFFERAELRRMTVALIDVPIDPLREAAEELVRRCALRVERLAARADLAHTLLCFRTQSFGATWIRDCEVMMVRRGGPEVSPRDRVLQFPVQELPKAGPLGDAVEALTRAATPSPASPTRAQCAVRDRDVPSALFAMRVGDEVRSFESAGESLAFEQLFVHALGAGL